MAIRFSTKLRNMLLGGATSRHVAVLTAADITAVDGGAGADSFTSGADAFLTSGFYVGDSIMVYGFTGGMAAIHGPFTITSVTAGTIEVATGSLAADDLGETVTIVALVGGSLRDIFKKGVLRIYSGSQPSSADAAYGATLLCSISIASGAFVAGAVANGLEFGAAAAGVLAKGSEVWSGTCVATGTAGWFRLMANTADASGLDSGYLYPRIDGSIGTSGADLNMGSTSLTSGATLTIDTFSITLPAE